LALCKDKENLAYSALIKKKRIADLIGTWTYELSIVEETLARMKSEIGEPGNKLTETGARQHIASAPPVGFFILAKYAASSKPGSGEQQLRQVKCS
jgi:phage shock protein A